ncbi:MarR family transcriptional regulator [Dactylosporangium vinaceum]|uniref:MarR family winged helix-turn-helix transcriptional regulator n=1 Tax=Dactylosporangium vinaceum TaxID=53362 RepID=A0ABV5M1N2_9ACTN|nr:MarR family transcriptional regulator [Dactylosporangium vinaceum]UAB99252.1 MarR family transcriptional regulator [Dactylosporangium vinaceum]
MDRESLADALATQLNSVRRALRRRLRAGLAVPALPASQVELLRLVERSPGIGVSGAAARLHLAGNSVSTLVNQLTAAGLLRRERDPADGRSARLFLTDAATARLDAWRAARISLLATAMDQLTAHERNALASAVPPLARLATIMAAEARGEDE